MDKPGLTVGAKDGGVGSQTSDVLTATNMVLNYRMARG